MRVVHSLVEIPPSVERAVVTIGNFDGVHCGHQLVIRRVNERARALGAQSVVVTFDPHPAVVLGKAAGLKLITPLARKLELLSQTGVDTVLVLPFTEALSQWSPREFAKKVLCDALRVTEVHEGENFRFGRGAEADISSLAELGSEFGFTVTAAEPYILRATPISSSRVRALISAGDMSYVRALLGRPFAIRSTPAPGRGIGATHAVPTINLAPYTDLLPANGVYITTLRIENPGKADTFQGVTNVGNRPTFGADSFAVESHLFGFKAMELSTETQLELTFLRRLRGEKKFDSPADLKTQITRDVGRAQRYFALMEARDIKLG